MPHSDRTALDDEATSLALAAGRGDRVALGEFIARTQGHVWRFLAHLTDPDAADDLTQETYLRAMDALASFRGEAPARSWLLTIARRTAADRVRYEVARPSVPCAPGDCGPDAVGDTTERVEIAAMLAWLDADRREALVLTQVFGYSYAEAAEITGVAVGTIRSRVARARADLVARWSDAAAELDALRLAG
ncbi:MAG: sigma-70 family RNA polymerase sigma factor [Propionibacteriaceae bacterium]|nr:sigma-70 family RNA polymerase sigma factor [Propionibacteriaceae bacterium]